MKFIGINGKFRTGKDYVAKHVSRKIRYRNYYTERIAFGDNLKAVIEIITNIKRKIVDVENYTFPVFDYTEEQREMYLSDWNMKLGKMFQFIGTDVMRNHFDEKVWIKSALNNCNEDNRIYIFPDVRFINEFEELKNRGSFLIRVIRDESITKKLDDGRSTDHQSETDLDKIGNENFDLIINNNKENIITDNNIDFILKSII